MLSYQTKGILTIISAICIHIILGNVYTWSNINHYLASYLHIKDTTIKQTDCFFIVPITILADTYVIFLAGKLEKYIGTRILSLFASSTGVICHLIIYFTESFWIIIIGFILYGIGIGIGYYPILKTSWKYFPEKKGLLTGIILCVFGLCSMIFTTLADAVINPGGTPMDDGIYPPEIAIKMKDFALIMSAVMLFFLILSQILMRPLDNVVSTDRDYLVKIAITKAEPEISNEINESSHYTKSLRNNFQNNVTNDDETVSASKIEPFSQAAKSWRFHMLNLMSVGTLFFGYLSTNTTRAFGGVKELDEKQLQWMSKVCGLLNAFFRIGWGFIYDKFGFRVPYTTVCIIQILVSASFYHSALNIYTYYITNILENVVFSGHGTIFPPLITKIFGMKNSVTLFGITGYYIGTAGFLGPVIAKFVIKNDNDFLIVYLIGCAFAIMGFIITCFVKEEKFDYIPLGSLFMGRRNKSIDCNQNVPEYGNVIPAEEKKENLISDINNDIECNKEQLIGINLPE